MQLMNKKLQDIVKGIKTEPTQPNKLIGWQSRDDRANSIIGLAILDSELHCVDLDKSSNKI